MRPAPVSSHDAISHIQPSRANPHPMENTMDDENASWWVVVNDEEQYSIWNAGQEIPNGWRPLGSPRSRQECLDHIEREWTDMRPKSLREALGKAQ